MSDDDPQPPKQYASVIDMLDDIDPELADELRQHQRKWYVRMYDYLLFVWLWIVGRHPRWVRDTGKKK